MRGRVRDALNNWGGTRTVHAGKGELRGIQFKRKSHLGC